MTAIELSIIAPALLACLLVLSTHVPLGTEVLRRGIIFIDLAIAQVAGLGVIAADTMGWEAKGWAVQIAAVSAALLAAYILHWTDKRLPKIQEALIGVAFVLAATAGILMLAENPHGGEHLKELLVSNHSSSQGYGAAGLFPDLSAARPDGTSFRIAHTTAHSAGDIFGLFIALNTGSSLGIPPLHLGGISGNLYLGPFALTFLTGGSMSTSSQDTEVVAAKPGTVPASAKGVQVYFQGFVTTGNQTALTNLAAVKY